VFSFGDTARESYERMIELVSDAEEYLAQHGAALSSTPPPAPPALRRDRIVAFGVTCPSRRRPDVPRLHRIPAVARLVSHRTSHKSRGPMTPTTSFHRSGYRWSRCRLRYASIGSTSSYSPGTSRPGMFDPAPMSGARRGTGLP
jgi:hypothetical protein